MALVVEQGRQPDWQQSNEHIWPQASVVKPSTLQFWSSIRLIISYQAEFQERVQTRN